MTTRYSNRELSLLDFQRRVLALAEDPNLPILERVKFVAIVGSNLDEFFQVRVAGLREQVATGVGVATPDGLTPSQQLAAIRTQVIELVHRMERLVTRDLFPALADHGIELVGWDDLTDEEQKQLSARYDTEIYPILTPLAVDPAHPFPYISNLSLNLAVTISGPRPHVRFARVKVPPLLPRFLTASEGRLVPVEQVIGAHLDSLFPGLQVTGFHPFRVTRSADQAVEEDEADDLLEAMESLLQTRHRFSRLIRLEVDTGMPPDVVQLLSEEMGIDEDEIYDREGLLHLGGLWNVYALDRPELKEDPWVPTTQPALAETQRSFFDRLDRDLLVHLPYDSFATSVSAFIRAAAADPDVVAIKQTLYRTADPRDPALGGEEAIVHSLISAARAGKQVVVLVELKARFDEEANIAWARLLEEAGAHVVYGVLGLKTHAKIALVVRRDAGGLRRYAHIGTGNYNPKTARIYEDLGVFTSRPDIGADLSELFNALTGYGTGAEYRRLLVAPDHLRGGVIRLIREEAAKGAGGSITMKLNHLADPEIIDELYAASDAGTPVDLIVRGICCLRPGVAGFSENITVRSIVGKYLEHSRILRFGSGDEATYLIGSADMMPRNLNGRVEALVPIDDPTLRDRLDEVLAVVMGDDRLAWELVDQAWAKVPTVVGLNSHTRFQDLALQRARGATPNPDTAPRIAEVVAAAGGLVARGLDSGRELLLVHRPAYDDWTFPKGKVDPGETERETALREVLEETGIECRLGDEVGWVEYEDRNRNRKVVRYWWMDPIRGSFVPNGEVDVATWVSPEEALQRLTYERDRALLRSALAS